tara:strand:- start:1138 stop:1479 length:342 start_codon:yes stop_codon:yes gene_type:complete
MIGEKIDECIKDYVASVLGEGNMPELPDDLVATDNIGEVIEKSIILHIRTWMLEDKIGIANDDSVIADLKRKIDICFKQKRPQYIQAINRMIDNAIINDKTLVEDSVKNYSGH